MVKDCSTCIHKEGSCYPSLTIFDKDKICGSYEPDYESNIDELEKENEQLKSELTKKADTNHSLVEQMADLESENAELKDKLTALEKVASALTYQRTVGADNRIAELENEKGCETCTKFDEVQLTKAKEIIKGWLGDFYSPKAFYDKRAELVEQSEQFLKEIEK